MRQATLRAMFLACLVPAAAHAQGAGASDPAAAAGAALAQIEGTIMVPGTSEPVEVIRDRYGVPHIYAKNTADLFFAQGFVVAQDRMWQLEMWRRNGEGRLAEVLGKDYVRRDTFARLLQFHGNWDAEYQKYHPQGKLIFDSFARGVNAAIQKALDEKKTPVEFDRMGFAPQPVWTARTILTRMAGWAMTRNASSEVARALDIKRLGLEKTRELKPTDPERAFTVPEGLDLDDIEPGILDIARDANNFNFPAPGGAFAAVADAGAASPADERPSASNNWVIGGAKSSTGKPLLANDPHRNLVNPALRYLVHLNAPGWNAIGATEPGVPGISVGHNDRVAWGFTILGVDQQDLYVEETDPQNPDRYLWKGEWRDMVRTRELIFVKGQVEPVEVTLKRTHHGPVLSENTTRHRAYALRWAGAETGGAGYVGSLGVMQSRNWQEFKSNVGRAWFIPSHSIVYADVDGNIGYLGVALSPVRRNWDGLLPVPGKDGRYEWEGYVPFEKLPSSLNPASGFFNTSNNDVVPKIVPGYDLPLGFEYSQPFRYNRVLEVLKSKKVFTLADMQALQQDTLSLPARILAPLVLDLALPRESLIRAQRLFLGWDFSLRKESAAAALFEAFQSMLPPLAYAPFLTEEQRFAFRGYDLERVLQWMTDPPRAYGDSPKERKGARDRILTQALEQALAHMVKTQGEDPKAWAWGNVHGADFLHPLARSKGAEGGDVFAVTPAPRGGDGNTVMATSYASETNTRQIAGASFSFVADVADWDRSTFLSAPGNSAQPLSPFYSNLVESWAAGNGNPLAFSRARVEGLKAATLLLQPILDRTAPSADEPFEPVQKALFAAPGGQPVAVADYDNDGDLDVYVGFRGAPSRLYRNEGGRFSDVASSLGLEEGDEV
ncbi:MAG: penicillin acylase family protein, partial [Vicinamibacteria bacterium]|nr:penicillin acylase family protein [Vicinamibacteria bacterium]